MVKNGSYRFDRLALASVLIAVAGLPSAQARDPDTPDLVKPYASVFRQFIPTDGIAAIRSDGKMHRALVRRLGVVPPGERIKVWVFFSDKGIDTLDRYEREINEFAERYGRRAVERRRNRRTRPGLFDEHDLPVVESYIAAVRSTGTRIHIISRWLNGVSVVATKDELERIDRLPFVRILQSVGAGRRIMPDEMAGATADGGTRSSANRGGGFYGVTASQLAQINLIAVHDRGYTGKNVVIGMLDTGFSRTHTAYTNPDHPIRVIAERDFVDGDDNTAMEPGDPAFPAHGTVTLSTIGAYWPDQYVGGAYDASFILCKTEDVTQEVRAEEDNYVAGLEFIEAHGGDVATSSLGYLTFDNPFDSYSQDDMDGQTAVSTLGVNIATGNGLHCLTSVGNRGNDSDPGQSSLGAPSDAFDVITVGAVDVLGIIADFSSDGPTADGRVKPEVLARGVATAIIHPFDDAGLTFSSGTSLSGPLVASVVGCLVDAFPRWTVAKMRKELTETATDFVANGTFDPLFVRGYGIVDAGAALARDCNDNGILDACDLDCAAGGCDAGCGTSSDCNANDIPDECERDCNDNQIPDECDVSDMTSDDCNANGVPDECEPDCNGNAVADSCDIAGGSSSDNNGNGIPDDCEVNAPVSAADPHDVEKNRYVSFNPNNPDIMVALAIFLPDGRTGWVGAPQLTSWSGEEPAWVSLVVGAPVFRTWTEETVHVGGCVVIPDETYELRATVDGLGFSAPFVVQTVPAPTAGSWADIVGDFDNGSQTWGPPNGFVNFKDIDAAVKKFQVPIGAPHVTVVDLHPQWPNYFVNFSDIDMVIKGFQGVAYPVPVTDCQTIANCPLGGEAACVP